MAGSEAVVVVVVVVGVVVVVVVVDDSAGSPLVVNSLDGSVTMATLAVCSSLAVAVADEAEGGGVTDFDDAAVGFESF